MKYYVFYTSIAEDWVKEFNTLDEIKTEINNYKDDKTTTIYDIVHGKSIYNTLKENK